MTLDITSGSDIFREFMKIQEASMVKMGVPVKRQFTDEELVPAFENLTQSRAMLDEHLALPDERP